MSARDLISISFFNESRLLRRALPACAFLFVLATLALVFLVVPNERVMGAVQRIFYFHVGLAMASYLMIGVLFVASVLYLATHLEQWDFLGQAANSVAVLMCTGVLASGMIWGHSAWNTWWRWEPRLVSFLVLWLILVSYELLRLLSDEHSRQQKLSAVLGIIAAVNVPLVMFSIRLLQDADQLHPPDVVAGQGLRHPSFVYTLIVANVGVIFLSLWLLFSRVWSIALEREVMQVKRLLSSELADS